MKQYDRLDAEFYDYYSTGIAGDVAFYVQEAQKADGPALELGCGTGRILIPIAQGGVRITGLDRSPSMLAVAKKKVSALNARTRERIRLVRGDMRDFALRTRYNLIIVPYRAFLHLLTPEDQRQALVNIRKHLADGGHLIMNNFDPRLDIIAEHTGILGNALKKDDEFVQPRTRRHVIVWDSRSYDPANQLVDQLFIFEELDEMGRSLKRTASSYTLRYIYRYEMEYLFELSGFQVEALYGDFKRGPFHYGGEQIWVARKSNAS